MPERKPNEEKFFHYSSRKDLDKYWNYHDENCASVSGLFRHWDRRVSRRRRIVTIQLSNMSPAYLTTSLGEELVLSEEVPGRTEVRMVFTEDGLPCQFLLQRYSKDKHAYERVGVSLHRADIENLLAAMLIYRDAWRSDLFQPEDEKKVVLATLLNRVADSPLNTCLLYTSPSPRDS